MHCKIVVVLFGVFAALSVASNPLAARGSCDCYRTDNGLTFLNRAWDDFRDISEGKFVHPAMPPVPVLGGLAPLTSPFFGGANFKNWAIQSWSQPADGASSPIDRVNSPGNVYISSDSVGAPTHLTLRTARLLRFQSIAEIDTKVQDIVHGSFRYRARTTGAAGACAGFFTYQSDTQEIDLEVLTADPSTQFHATNQPGATPGATSVVPVNGDRSQWNTWRVDWQDGMTEFFFNDASVNQITVNTPTQPSVFLINLWSDGGSWSGTMNVGDFAFADIEWIDLLYNTTSDVATGCTNVCQI